MPSLGYLLGDEGGGADLGRHLIRQYYYRQLPEELRQAFAKRYNTNKYELIQALQHAPQPNRHLAAYTQFIIEYQHHPAIKALVKARFVLFLERQVAAYKGVEQLPIHFIGSVAHGFQHRLREAIEEKGWTVGQVLQSPFPALLDYHLQIQP